MRDEWQPRTRDDLIELISEALRLRVRYLSAEEAREAADMVLQTFEVRRAENPRARQGGLAGRGSSSSFGTGHPRPLCRRQAKLAPDYWTGGEAASLGAETPNAHDIPVCSEDLHLRG